MYPALRFNDYGQSGYLSIQFGSQKGDREKGGGTTLGMAPPKNEQFPSGGKE
jgi:hypothetical protein